MKQALHIKFKNGNEVTIYCEHFTFTSVGVLVIDYEDHIEKLIPRK